jgi:sec-independent protein translocase protein TatB
MFNIGGAEFLVIALVALLVLGPDKLPEAARKVGNITSELRKMSNGFRSEFKEALNDPIEAAARERGNKVAPPRANPVVVDPGLTEASRGPTPDVLPGPSPTGAGPDAPSEIASEPAEPAGE